MIISKKKFEKLVEEEVHKRMNAADEKRWQEERYRKLVDDLEQTKCRMHALREEFNELKRDLRRANGCEW